MGMPRGSKYPNSRVSGPKIHTLNGFWTLKPYYLGTWTLRDGLLEPNSIIVVYMDPLGYAYSGVAKARPRATADGQNPALPIIRNIYHNSHSYKEYSIISIVIRNIP